MTDAGSTGVERPRRWQPWHFILIGIVALAAFVGILLSAVLTLTRPVVDGGDSFMAALKDGDFGRAYGEATPDLQRELGSAADLAKMVETHRPAEWSWSQRSIRNGVGRVEGGVTFAGGRRGTARIVLHKVGGQWRVAAFQLTPS